MTTLSPRSFAQKIWQKARTPLHVRLHMEKVALVAKKIALAAQKKGFRVNRGLVERSALVHDACKIESMQTGLDEKKLLATVLANYPEIFRVVRQTDLPFLLREEAFENIESLIVYYADKRVRHTDVVSLKTRLADLLFRYPKYRVDIQRAAPRVLELEQAIARQFGFKKNLDNLA